MKSLNNREYLIGMAGYLHSRLGQNPDVIKQELIEALSASERDPEVVRALATLGDSNCIEAYARVHGFGAFRTLNCSDYASGVQDQLIEALGIRAPEHFVRCLHLLKNNITSRATPEKSAAQILIKAKRADRPELIAPSFEALDLTPEHVRARFFLNSHTFDMRPRFAQWMVNFMAREVTPEQTGTEGFGEHIDRLLRKGDVHGIAAYVRLGYDIRPGFEHGLINDQGNEWFNRLARRLSSAHDQIELLSRLPDLEGILMMDKVELTHLVAGKSNKEMRREAGLKKRLAHEANVKEEQEL
jgi:hypothetical protein